MNNSINYCGFIDMLDRSANRQAAPEERLGPRISAWNTARPERHGAHSAARGKTGQTQYGEYKPLS